MSNALPTQGPLADLELPVLDDELHAICPDCKQRIHWVKKSVWMLKPKKSKNPLKDGKLSGWLCPKTPAVLSTVTAPAAIQMVIAPNTPILGHPPSPYGACLNSTIGSEAPQSLLDQLRAAIRMLPVTVPEATELDALAAFARDPSRYVDSEIPAIEVYEQLNPIFHAALGGVWMDSFSITYFVHQRGVREQDFAAKIKQILNAIKFLTPASAPNDGAHSHPAPYLPEADEIKVVVYNPAPNTTGTLASQMPTTLMERPIE
ncbi:hypothetical protein B0H14DRAFT_3901528 [Mycena olivaceomarginata]|nr:hypothetical protein B0H14DRAFT_3901528 [Mycena olivaceomarginata]